MIQSGLNRDHRSTFLKAALLITIATLLSKVLGLVRFQLIFYFFGTEPYLDAFWSGFRLPNSLRDLIAEGAFSASFVMICTKVLIHRGSGAVIDFTNKILSSFSVFVLGVCVLLLVLNLPFTNYFLVGTFHNNQETLWMAASVLELFLPFLFILSIASLFMGLLNSLDRYWVPAIAPFFSNIAFIVLLFFLHDSLGVVGLVVAQTVGAITQLVLQLVVSLKIGWRFQWNFDLRDRYVQDFLKIFFPILLIMAFPKITGFITNYFATSPLLPSGSLSSYEYAFFVIQLPISVYVTGISMVSLTNLSKYFEEKAMYRFRELMSWGSRLIIVASLPVMVLFLLLSEPITRFIYKDFMDIVTGHDYRGKDILNIGSALFFMTPGILSMSLSVIFIRGYQGMKIWKIPLLISLVMIAVHAAGCYLFTNIFKWELTGIIVSFVIASYLSCFLLGWVIIRKIGSLDWKAIFKSTLHSIIGSIAVAVLLFGFQFLISWGNPIYNVLVISLLVGFAALIYCWVMVSFKEEEFIQLFDRLFKRFSKRSY